MKFRAKTNSGPSSKVQNSQNSYIILYAVDASINPSPDSAGDPSGLWNFRGYWISTTSGVEGNIILSTDGEEAIYTSDVFNKIKHYVLIDDDQQNGINQVNPSDVYVYVKP